MPSERLYVLDTNVLMHDPTALFRFHEHNVFLPMTVLEELDRAKQGTSELARNVRQTSRFLDELLEGASYEHIKAGLELPSAANGDPRGRLFFQTELCSGDRLASSAIADDAILATALELEQKYPDTTVIIVSKDINLRVKAQVLGLRAEDYYNDKVLDDVELLYTGLEQVADDFWVYVAEGLESWHVDKQTLYKVKSGIDSDWSPGQCLSGEDVSLIVNQRNQDGLVATAARNFAEDGHPVWGINARNIEQNFALNLLLDPNYDFVTLLGTAGTGKTLLALAAGLAQTLDEKRYREIVMTRVTVSVGEDIGFLPGTEEEKMEPWMGALMDNLEVLADPEAGGDWVRAAGNDLLRNRIKIHSVNFMRGRTFLNRYVIIDEAQNLTAKQMKTLITRAGPGTKIVCTGNIAQIDTPYLSETTSGLTYVIDRFRNWEHSAHITLRRGERSRLADFAAEIL